MTFFIDLTPNQIHMAASHAILRRYEKHCGRRGDRPEIEDSDWNNEIEGACCELAVTIWQGIPWTGVGGLRAKDAGEFEVKWTRHNGRGGLIVHKHMDDDSKYILFDGKAPRYTFVGWAYGRDAKQEKYLQKAGYYLMPRDHLRKNINVKDASTTDSGQ